MNKCHAIKLNIKLLFALLKIYVNSTVNVDI